MNTRQKKKYIRRCAGKNVRIDWNKPVMGFIGEWAFGPKLINPTIKQRYHELLWSKRWIKQLKKLAEEAKEREKQIPQQSFSIETISPETVKESHKICEIADFVVGIDLAKNASEIRFTSTNIRKDIGNNENRGNTDSVEH